ncbi:50S ribosomal protein L25/general stress protein Ctc [Gracilibacillus caseinilyticus]|uniref:Large ribosomal subunit protein bL25 n=1 Tax=Gracilibacillus caseinilyticus TaxID=2932256 RepID=A0ABY4EYP7_9BACI|nr:50S ribosomal protein L25/general stress protein Ctc [Gracilibacillus caseinilyticus]UOQ49523.1 50S ribosomal protein L25/general stress protein Ctc [Gracilibacillus caseinilyticus]
MAITLEAKKREDLRTSNTKAIRLAGEVPAIIYGYQVDPKTVAVNSLELLKTVRDEGKNAIISLLVDGDSVDVMLHEYQIDPLKDELVHADFYAVNMKEELDVQVPVVLNGEAIGVNEGGVLQQPLYELALRAKPKDIPEQITIEVADLNVGDSILVSDLKEGKNYEILEDEGTTIVSILVPDEEPAEEPEATEESEEPEGASETKEDNSEE